MRAAQQEKSQEKEKVFVLTAKSTSCAPKNSTRGFCKGEWERQEDIHRCFFMKKDAKEQLRKLTNDMLGSCEEVDVICVHVVHLQTVSSPLKTTKAAHVRLLYAFEAAGGVSHGEQLRGACG